MVLLKSSYVSYLIKCISFKLFVYQKTPDSYIIFLLTKTRIRQSYTLDFNTRAAMVHFASCTFQMLLPFINYSRANTYQNAAAQMEGIQLLFNVI